MRHPDLSTFERTYRAEGPFVAAVLGRLAVPPEAMHDAVQDVFVAAFRRWPDYDQGRPVRPWLTAFAHRVAFRYRRSAARRDRKQAAFRHVFTDRQRPDAERAIARAFLERFLGSLDEGHRRVFILSELEGRTAPEVARLIGISTEAVYGRVRSVRKRLHRALMDDARRPDARVASTLPPFATLVTKIGMAAPAVGGVGLSVGLTKTLSIAAVVGVLGVVGVAGMSSQPDPPEPRPVAPSVAAAPPRAESTVRPSVARTPVAASVVEPRADPEPTAQAQAEPARRPAVAVAEADPTSTLQAEAALLRDAKQAQGLGRLEHALAKLDAHALRFPDGQLAAARSRARIRVLCDLGRTAQARGEARLLAARAPGDPLAIQALEICVAPIQSSAEPEKQGRR